MIQGEERWLQDAEGGVGDDWGGDWTSFLENQGMMIMWKEAWIERRAGWVASMFKLAKESKKGVGIFNFRNCPSWAKLEAVTGMGGISCRSHRSVFGDSVQNLWLRLIPWVRSGTECGWMRRNWKSGQGVGWKVGLADRGSLGEQAARYCNSRESKLLRPSQHQ